MFRNKETMMPAKASGYHFWQLDRVTMVTWLQLLLAFGMLAIAVRSIEAAEWIEPQPALLVVLLLSFVTTYFSTRLPLKAVWQHAVILMLGLLVLVWQSALVQAAATEFFWGSRFLSGLSSWWQSIISNSPNHNTAYFSMMLIAITWLAGYISACLLLKKGSTWAAMLLGLAFILINLVNLDKDYYIYFFLYLAVALFSIGVNNAINRYRQLRKRKIIFPAKSISALLVFLLLFSSLSVFISWQIPPLTDHPVPVLAKISAGVKQGVSDSWWNAVAAVPGKQDSFLNNSMQQIQFDSTFHSGEEVLFVIESPEMAYWRLRMYDNYTGSGWESSRSLPPLLESQEPGRVQGIPENSEVLNYTVTGTISSDLLLVAGDFNSASVEFWQDVLAPRNFSINLLSSSSDRQLPDDVAFVARTIRSFMQAENINQLSDIRRILPEELALVNLGADRYPPTESNFQILMDNGGPGWIEVKRVRLEPANSISVLSLYSVQPGESYKVTSILPTANEDALALAGENYPAEIQDYYLTLPRSVPERVRELALALTQGISSPYYKALAIKQYLSLIPYSEENPKPPPDGVDAVDYFVFERRFGNCNYFATSMAVMLRASGVPARFCIGYLPGEQDENSSNVIIREKHYHAWAEVYFPGYGWVEIEATPEGEQQQVLFDDWPMAYLNLDMAITDGSTSSPRTIEAPSEESDITASDTAISSDEAATPVNPDELQPPMLLITGIFGSLLILFLTAAFYGWLWHFPGDSRIAIYHKMCLLASWLKIAPTLGQTPAEYGLVLRDNLPSQNKNINMIISSYEESYYGKQGVGSKSRGEQLELSWQETYRALLKKKFRWRW